MEFERENIGEREARRDKVKKAFREFELTFEIEKYPDLLERLVDTGEHFHDAVEMAHMIDKIWDKLEIDDADRDTLLASTLMHDIGKAGPLKVVSDSKMREVVGKLFPHGDSNAKTFQDLVAEVGLGDDAAAIADHLSDENHIITGGTPAIDFWRRHVDWTYEVLSAAGVDKKILEIAASHHILDGKNPAHIADDNLHRESKILEVADKYHAHGHRVLTIIDRYQAIRERGRIKSHKEIIAFLHRIVDKSCVSQILKDDYHDIIDNVLAQSKNDLDAVFGDDSNSRE